MSRTIAGRGTDEATWRPWLAEQDWPPLDPDTLAGADRLVVLAAHPDDEILGIGGLLAVLAAREARLVLIWASDGEAAQPSEQRPDQLARQRRCESARALATLDVAPHRTTWLELPDSRIGDAPETVRAALRASVDRDDVVLAPWRDDGHPDHDACGHAAALVAGEREATLLEYPIWAWHWAVPGQRDVPWGRARRIGFASDVAAAKVRAVGCLRSQTRRLGPRPDQAPVLPPWVLARFLRSEEVVFG